jgi:hypothetical protein
MSGTDLRNPDFPVSVARPLEFVIVFAGARECPLNVSMPYQFSAAGITLSGDPAPMESIQFKPKIIVRPGFKLPY